GASEAGEPTIGLNITLPQEQTFNPYITPGLNFKFHYFALRKMHFMMRAKALVTFPGGFGTMDELFEILTLVQTGKSKPVPIVLYNSNYWQRLLHLDVMVEEGMIDQEDLRLFRYANTPEEAWAHIAEFYRLA
ncbi:MAG: LOG family protein, partial [Brachymonas sp.]|nr:LOG family protein [Brachymonas sp.]